MFYRPSGGIYYLDPFKRVHPIPSSSDNMMNSEVNAETCLPVFTTGDLARWQVFFLCRQGSMTGSFSKFGFQVSDAMNFYGYAFIHSLIGPAVILSIVITCPGHNLSSRKRVARSSLDFPKQLTARANDTLPRSWQVTFSFCINPWGVNASHIHLSVKGRCWSKNCFAHFSTHSFLCTFIMISMKKYWEKTK